MRQFSKMCVCVYIHTCCMLIIYQKTNYYLQSWQVWNVPRLVNLLWFYLIAQTNQCTRKHPSCLNLKWKHFQSRRHKKCINYSFRLIFSSSLIHWITDLHKAQCHNIVLSFHRDWDEECCGRESGIQAKPQFICVSLLLWLTTVFHTTQKPEEQG